MMKQKNKRAAGMIVPAAVLVLVLVSFIATGAVYSRVFVRYDREAREYPGREEFVFSCGENELSGFLYGRGSEDLIVIVSGFRAVQEDYIPLAEALMDEGFSVFTFDPTGVGRSGGRDQKGFPQIMRDLDACLDMIEENGRFGCERITLLGHSRGGLAACMAASRVDRVITSGAPSGNMDGVIQGSYATVGAAAYLNYPMLWLWQTVIFGEPDTDASAVAALNGCDTEALILHGDSDKAVLPDRFSLYSRRDELAGSGHVTFMLLSGGHVDVLCSDGSANPDTVKLIAEFVRSDALEEAA